MAEITRIVIKGSSGYCCYDEAFNDKVTITQDSIAYEYVPYQETDINPKRKWSYKTNSPIFKMKYDEVAGMLSGIIERGVEEFCTDIGGIELFVAIRSLVSETEYTPAVLFTTEDYEDEEEEDE